VNQRVERSLICPSRTFRFRLAWTPAYCTRRKFHILPIFFTRFSWYSGVPKFFMCRMISEVVQSLFFSCSRIFRTITGSVSCLSISSMTARLLRSTFNFLIDGEELPSVWKTENREFVSIPSLNVLCDLAISTKFRALVGFYELLQS